MIFSPNSIEGTISSNKSGYTDGYKHIRSSQFVNVDIVNNKEIDLEEIKESDVLIFESLSEGNDGICKKMIDKDQNVWFCKFNKSGFSKQFIEFYNIAFNNQILRLFLPTKVFIKNEKRYYLYEWIYNSSNQNQIDVKEFMDQIEILHKFGFNHMDISPRNTIVSNGKLRLIDLNLICKHGTVPVGSLPADVSTDNSLRRNPVSKFDDYKGIKIVLKSIKNLKYNGHDFQIDESENHILSYSDADSRKERILSYVLILVIIGGWIVVLIMNRLCNDTVVQVISIIGLVGIWFAIPIMYLMFYYVYKIIMKKVIDV